VAWHNSAGAYISESDGPTGVADVTTGWTQFTVTGTAPAGSVSADVGIWGYTNSSSVAEVHYLDVAQIALGTSTTGAF
jgi:hypothetical protein